MAEKVFFPAQHLLNPALRLQIFALQCHKVRQEKQDISPETFSYLRYNRTYHIL